LYVFRCDGGGQVLHLANSECDPGDGQLLLPIRASENDGGHLVQPAHDRLRRGGRGDQGNLLQYLIAGEILVAAVDLLAALPLFSIFALAAALG